MRLVRVGKPLAMLKRLLYLSGFIGQLRTRYPRSETQYWVAMGLRLRSTVNSSPNERDELLRCLLIAASMRAEAVT